DRQTPAAARPQADRGADLGQGVRHPRLAVADRSGAGRERLGRAAGGRCGRAARSLAALRDGTFSLGAGPGAERLPRRDRATSGYAAALARGAARAGAAPVTCRTDWQSVPSEQGTLPCCVRRAPPRPRSQSSDSTASPSSPFKSVTIRCPPARKKIRAATVRERAHPLPDGRGSDTVGPAP